MLMKKEINDKTALEISASAEYKDLSVDVASVLKNKKLYKDKIVTVVVEGALTLLDLPSAIQQQPTLDPSKAKKYEVASRKSKQGKVECTPRKSHVSCQCASFKYDRVCSHSIAVAQKVGILNQHLQFISKKSNFSPRMALAEGFLDKRVAGKKGSTSKNPY